MYYSIKQVSEKKNIASHTLRYYDKEGLLPFVERSKSGIRKFSDSDLEWLDLICCLKSTGMTIKQIKEFVKLTIQGDETLNTRCNMLVEHEKIVKEQIRTMEMHLEKVTYKIGYFNKKYKEYIETKG